MSQFDTPDDLEDPPAGYPASLRVQMALEARLKTCPGCRAPAFQFESSRFQKPEGDGCAVKVRFMCEAGCAVMVLPSGDMRVYAVDPCRELMRQSVERLTAQAATFAASPLPDPGGGA